MQDIEKQKCGYVPIVLEIVYVQDDVVRTSGTLGDQESWNDFN